MTSTMDLTALEKDPRLFLYTSLTAGSSHIVTATSRMETILKANKIPFQAIDLATDEQARRLWQRRAGKRKLPGLVKEGFVVGDLNEVEEWNEFGELRENIGPVPAGNVAVPKGGPVGVQTAPALSHNITPAAAGTSTTAKSAAPAPVSRSQGIALPGAAEIAARSKKSSPPASASAVSGGDKSTPMALGKSADGNVTKTPTPELSSSKVNSQKGNEPSHKEEQGEDDVPEASAAVEGLKISEPSIDDTTGSSEAVAKTVEADETTKGKSSDMVDVPARSAETEEAQSQPAKATERAEADKKKKEEEEEDKAE